MKASEAILDHVFCSLAGLSQGDAGRKADELAKHYGVVRQTVFSWAKKRGLRWRKEKTTKGNTSVGKEALTAVSALLYASRRSSNEIPMPTCDAVELLQDSGVAIDVSSARICTLLRERDISARDLVRPTPHQTLLSEHPNHVWQFDVTNCLQYFLDEKKGMGERDPDMELYKNKIVKTAKTIKRELLRYVAVDHCTGAFYFEYFYASGERAIDGADFLLRAMRPKDELIKARFNGSSGDKLGKYHLHGVPYLLIPDRGSIIVDKANQNLFKGLRIDVQPHLPGNPRAKGAVEGLMHYINRFEARLKFQRPADLAELNRWALDWCIYVNGAKEMRGVAPRSAMWSTIRPEQLRLCPDEHVYRMLLRRPEVDKRCDGGGYLRHDGRTYRVPDSNACNRTVKLVILPYEYPNVEVHYNGYIWALQPIEKDQYGRLQDGVTYGDYHSLKDTRTQTAKKEMEKVASEQWGLGWKGTGQKRIAVAPPVGHETPLQVFGHQAQKVKVQFLSRPGSELDVQPQAVPENKPVPQHATQVSRSIIARRIPFIDFLVKLKAEIGSDVALYNQTLRSKYADGIDINEAEEVIRQITAGTYGDAAEEKRAAAL